MPHRSPGSPCLAPAPLDCVRQRWRTRLGPHLHHGPAGIEGLPQRGEDCVGGHTTLLQAGRCTQPLALCLRGWAEGPEGGWPQDSGGQRCGGSGGTARVWSRTCKEEASLRDPSAWPNRGDPAWCQELHTWHPHHTGPAGRGVPGPPACAAPPPAQGWHCSVSAHPRSAAGGPVSPAPLPHSHHDGAAGAGAAGQARPGCDSHRIQAGRGTRGGAERLLWWTQPGGAASAGAVTRYGRGASERSPWEDLAIKGGARRVSGVRLGPPACACSP